MEELLISRDRVDPGDRGREEIGAQGKIYMEGVNPSSPVVGDEGWGLSKLKLRIKRGPGFSRDQFSSGEGRPFFSVQKNLSNFAGLRFVAYISMLPFL